MRQKNQDTGTPKAGTPETSGDGVLKDLAAKAAALAPALTAGTDGDPRRRGEIEVLLGGTRCLLKIDGVLWGELDWSKARNAWCVQDACGHCLNHIEHMHKVVPESDNPRRSSTDPMKSRDKALEVAKQMIRDGSMPSPEDAKSAFKKKHGTAFPY